MNLKAPINAAAMIIERKTGNVKAYVGSSDYLKTERKGAVNYLTAVRSPGSTLKPFIYATAALQRGLINLTTFIKIKYSTKMVIRQQILMETGLVKLPSKML